VAAREQDGVAGFDDGAPERDRQMRFADTRRAKIRRFRLGRESAPSPARHQPADRRKAGT